MINLAKLPFTYHWIMHRAIDGAKTVLDIGCGDGVFTADLARGQKWSIVGVELYDQSIAKAKKKKIYKKIIKADVTKLPASLPLSEIVLASQVIEHLPKKKGLIFLNSLEKFASRRIIVSTPVGFMPFHQLEREDQDQNPYQKHLSGWEIEEFKKRGYRVYGQGSKTIYNSLLAKYLPKKLFWLLSLLSFIFAPINYFNPSSAMYMIAVKDKN